MMLVAAKAVYAGQLLFQDDLIPKERWRYARKVRERSHRGHVKRDAYGRQRRIK